MTKFLVKDGFTIVSGLASGIDTMAHSTAIENGGRTIAVIGTPLNQVYPKENEGLQKLIAKEHLLVSQVPFLRYSSQGIKGNRLFFPERNKTMSALTEATIIIEASETSGTLVQARAALQQGRHLFILDSCFHNKDITWPLRFERQGAIRVKDYEDIKKVLLNEEAVKNR
jgi:DNA processing protein